MYKRKWGRRGTGKGIRGRCMLLAWAVGLLFVAHNGLTVFAGEEDSAIAAVMQLMKTEGEVAVLNGSGKSISLIKNMRLYNGYFAATQEESYA